MFAHGRIFPFSTAGMVCGSAEYRASRIRGDGRDSKPGKGGWFGREGPTSPSEMGRGQVVPLGRSVGVPQRGMRPAGVVGQSRQVSPVGVLDVKGNSAIRPLSAEAIEFSPTPGPRTDVRAGRENLSSRAGGVAPAVVADFPGPTGAGVRFSAVAEVHASASEVDEDTLVVQARERHTERNINLGKAPRVVSVPTAGAFV